MSNISACYEALVAVMLREDFISASNARDLDQKLSELGVYGSKSAGVRKPAGIAHRE